MRKQLDPRIPILINNNVKKNHRSFIVLVGDKGRDQVRLSSSEALNRDLLLVSCLQDCEFALPPFPSKSIGSSFCSLVL